MCWGRVRGVHGLVDVFAGAVGGASYVKGRASAAVSAAARCETPSPGGAGRRRRRRLPSAMTGLGGYWSAARPERRSRPPPGGGGWAGRRCARGRRCRCAAGRPSGSPDPGRCAGCPGKSEHEESQVREEEARGGGGGAGLDSPACSGVGGFRSGGFGSEQRVEEVGRWSPAGPGW